MWSRAHNKVLVLREKTDFLVILYSITFLHGNLVFSLVLEMNPDS